MSTFLASSWWEMLREWMSSPLVMVLICCLVGYMALRGGRREYPTYDDEDYEKEGHVLLPAPLKNLRLNEKMLKGYDSENPKGTYLLALQGILYDVSGAPLEFGPNGSYADLSGTEILGHLEHVACLEARSVASVVSEWKTLLEDHFHEAGVLDNEVADVVTDDENVEENANTFEDLMTDDESGEWDDVDETIIAT